MTTIYDFSVKDANGKIYSLDKYKGQVIMVVNTATKCGLRGQFSELEDLYENYQNRGFVVLGFPSNQFHQEVENGQVAEQSCQMTYGVTFPMHDIIAVNGKEADPLFIFLKNSQPGILTDDIKWNFTKFLIDRQGRVVGRYGPKTSPLDAKVDIEKRLSE